MSLRSELDLMRPTGTWIGHTLLCVAVSLVAAIWGWFVVGALGMALFYVVREAWDKRLHVAKGDYDKPGPDGVTPRVDKVGDVLGPLAYACGVVLAWLVL